MHIATIPPKPEQPPQKIAALVYLGVPATSPAYCGYYHAIRRIGGVASGIFIYLVPLFALLFGWLFLDEMLHAGELAGGLLVISGVITAMRANTLRNPPS